MQITRESPLPESSLPNSNGNPGLNDGTTSSTQAPDLSSATLSPFNQTSPETLDVVREYCSTIMRLRRAHTVAASRSEDGRVGAETMPAREAAASEVSHRAELDKKLKARLRRFRGSHAREEAKVAALALRLRTIQEQMGLEPATERVSIVSELAAARAENAALKVKVRVLKMELGARATASREHHSASQTGSQVPTDSQTDETQRLLQQLMAQRDTEAMAASAVSTVPACACCGTC